MSVISDRHQFVEFTSGKSEPYDGQRLAKVGYKAKSGKKSQCVSVPKMSDAECAQINSAFPVDIRKRAEGMQDDLVRALYESGKSEITSSEIAVDQVIAFLNASSESNRLSAEVIAEWWNGFQDTALPVLAEKYSTTDTAILEKKSAIWGAAFSAVTGRSVMTADHINKLLGMLEYSDEDDGVATRIAEKLQEMLRTVKVMEEI